MLVGLLDKPIEVQLFFACTENDFIKLCSLLSLLKEEKMIDFAMQKKQHELLESIVKYIVTFLSLSQEENEPQQEKCEQFLELIST